MHSTDIIYSRPSSIVYIQYSVPHTKLNANYRIDGSITQQKEAHSFARGRGLRYPASSARNAGRLAASAEGVGGGFRGRLAVRAPRSVLFTSAGVFKIEEGTSPGPAGFRWDEPST